MEESILLHRLESRAPGHRGQAIDELIDIVRNNGKLLFSNKLSLFSAFKKILQDEDLALRTKCSKLIQELLPKLGQELDTCMSFVIANVLTNLGANNSSLKRESVKLIGAYAELAQDSGALIRPVIWEGIDNKDSTVSREVILSLDKLIANFIKTDDCYNIIQSLCKRYYLEENKKMKKSIRTGFTNIVNIIGHHKMKETVSQLPTTLVKTGKELLEQCPQTLQPNYTASRTKLEVDSAISVEMLWDLVPEQTIARLHGDDLEQQLLAIAELSEAIQMVAVPHDYLICIDEINESIIKVIPVNNFRVFKAALQLVQVFIDVFRDVIGDCVYPLTSVLCHKIGDNKIAVREGTMKVLTQMMETISPAPVLEVVIHSFKDRNARVREEAVNVVIKALLLFNPAQLEFRVLVPNVCQLLADTKPKVRLVALEALAVMYSILGASSYQMILGAADKLDTGHDRLAEQVATRLNTKGHLSSLNEAGLVVHSDMCTAALSRAGSSMSNTSFSVPTTSHERQVQDRLCPPTPIALPRRYCSAGRNRLPWERSSRQNTLIKAAEEQYPGNAPRPYDRSNHVFIKGGGARTDGGSYAQMHLKKLQKEEEPALQPSQHRSNTLGSLKKYFPSVKGSPDPKRSWPGAKPKDESEVSQPMKSNSFTSDGYSVQNASMFEGYRAGSGESSGVGTMTNTTPIGLSTNTVCAAYVTPSGRPEPQLNDSGIFEEQSFTIPKKSSEHSDSRVRESSDRVKARKEILQEEELRREEERLEQARREKLRSEEQIKEDKRRAYLEDQKEVRRRERLEDVRQGQLKLEQQRLELLQQEEELKSHHMGNGYVELSIAKKKLKQSEKRVEKEEKKKPKLAKTKTRTESLCRSEQEDTTPDIDIVGKGLSSNHIELPKENTKELIAKPAKDKTPLRAPSGVYGQRVQPNISPEESLTEDEESDQEDQARNGYPVGSGLSAATRMRFEKKRAQYAERQSAEQHRNYSVTSDDTSPRANGKPVSAPVESRMPDIKRSASKNNVRANSMRAADVRTEHDLADPLNNSALCDEKLEVPLSNPEGAMLEAVRSIKCPSGQEEWNIKVQALHVFRRLARHHSDLFTSDLVNMIRLTCTEIQNLRSTVSRLAIMVLGDYFECLTSTMDADIDRTCEVLLVKTAESNQFIRNDVQLALSKVVEHGTPIRVLNALILGGGQHKNSFVRSTAATFIKECVQKLGVGRVLAAKELTARYLVVLERLCHDGNQETRYNGKLMLSWCMELPGFDGLCVKSLPAAGARNLKDMADKLQTKGLGSCPNTDRTSGRYRSQPVSRAQSNLSATYPGNRSRKPSQDSAAGEVVASPRLTRRSGPRRDVRELANDRLPPAVFTKLGSHNWQERHAGIGELLELSVKQSADVRQSIVRVTDSFCPRLKDSNSKVNVYALQSLLKMLPHLSHSLDTVLTPFTEHLVPNLASQRANIVTITTQILDSLRAHVDNPALYCEYCRIVRTTANIRIKPIIIDKLCDMVRDVHSVKPKLVEQVTLPVITDNAELLQDPRIGRLCTLLQQVMGGNRLCNEVSRTKPGSVTAIREHLNTG